MADYTFTRPTREDMQTLAGFLRKEDKKELIKMVGPNLEREALHCLEASEVAYICKRDGVILAAFGIVRTNPFENRGHIWMLASHETSKHKIFTGKWSKKVLNAFLKDWDFLENWVDYGNDETLKWVKWMGGKVYPPEPYGLYGFLFHHITFGEE